MKAVLRFGIWVVTVFCCCACADLFFTERFVQGEYRAYGSEDVAPEWTGVIMVLEVGGQGRFVRNDASEEPFTYTIVNTRIDSARLRGVQVHMPSGREYGLNYDGSEHFTMWVSDTVTAVVFFSKL